MLAQIGKLVSDSIYIHKSALELLEQKLIDLVHSALLYCPEATSEVNVYRVDVTEQCVSLLSYPNFFDEAFPTLAASWRVSPASRHISFRTYKDSLNPPILHRKELLLPTDHPRYAEFSTMTEQAEQIGLFTNASRIGFKKQWDLLIRQAGYSVAGHQFQPIGNELGALEDGDGASDIQRHRTALSRTSLSAPMQALSRHGLLANHYSYFDYGCGRGDDLSTLRVNGLLANGWDPHFADDQPKLSADIVNLGFVINVIEDVVERREALQGAFALTKSLLVVSTMLYTANRPLGRPFGDGHLTQRNTFQKYYTQQELKEYIGSVLAIDPIAVAPGIVFVFRDKEAEQSFLYGRVRNRHALQVIRQRLPVKARPKPVRISRSAQLLEEHGALLTALWLRTLEVGRDLIEDEFDQAPAVLAAFGSWSRTVRWIRRNNPEQELAFAEAQRREDLIVYFALQIFARRAPYRTLQLTLQRDIRAHFGTYQNALATAQQYLTDVADAAALDAACVLAHAKGLGHYVHSDYLQVHVSLVEQLPALLRIYVGCGTVLFGDTQSVDLIKIHIRSAKLSFLRFDDFTGKLLPLMLERTKINLRSQSVDSYEYGEQFVPPPLYYKSRYINEEFENFPEQQAFDETLSALHLFDPESHGPSVEDLVNQLRLRRLEVSGFYLQRATFPSGLDEPCGANFTYRQLVACGETWEKLSIANVPVQPETYNALFDLATQILDPVIDYFGMVRLTYGFASADLVRNITSCIAPKLDQHASCELNRSGSPICSRKGAAVDFIVDDEDMADVAQWIARHLPFDRLYYYGAARPIHVSFGPDHTRQVTVMTSSAKSGRQLPRTLSTESFLARADKGF